ncbi:MAG: glycosyltransferase family 2 protein [Oceanospirillaceae bacterium]|nr:glycosyltransferase family 2 protein [Oceanospirillaceae bacterium]MCP5334543.1 glycosyltransferase family 2 protein [Oceanospirillaceae bacterium]
MTGVTGLLKLASWLGFRRQLTHGRAIDMTVSQGNWSWDSDDPKVMIRPKLTSLVPLCGFYMLEVQGKNDSPMNVKLYFDTGRGFKEEQAFQLLKKGRSGAKRICYFPENVIRFRLDPSDKPGSIAGVRVTLKKLSPAFARSRMLKKLSAKLGNFSEYDSQDPVAMFELYDQLAQGSTQAYSEWLADNEAGLWCSVVDNQNICFSVVVPVFNTPVALLKACVDSVLGQTYPNWQLILVDDASDKAATRDYLSTLEDSDSRIKVLIRSQNGHISEATNTGIRAASGDFVAFLDHDDTLAPQALNELAQCITDHPDVKFIYSDEDLISESGERIAPHFKSDWNPDLLLCHNYVTHLSCYRADVLKALGGLRKGVEGAQDYDLVLRTLSYIKPEFIQHIPKVLYHWRMVEGSTALSADAKSYATEAGLKALSDYFLRAAVNVDVTHHKTDNFYRVRWPLPDADPLVSVIIPTRDGLEVLKPCLDSLARTVAYPTLEVVIVDNHSVTPAAITYFMALAANGLHREGNADIGVQIVRDEGDFNFSRLMNVGAEASSGEYLLLLNNDIEAIQDGWLEEMLAHASRPDIGCVGAKLLYPDMTIQHAGVILGLGGYAAHSHRGIGRHESGYFCRAQVTQNLSAVTAACLMVRAGVYRSVSGFDESFAVAYNDVDFCLRVQETGLRNLYTPYAELIHHESKTRGEDITPEKQRRFDGEKQRLFSRWQSSLANDPYYSPNLTRSREDFSVL